MRKVSFPTYLKGLLRPRAARTLIEYYYVTGREVRLYVGSFRETLEQPNVVGRCYYYFYFADKET